MGEERYWDPNDRQWKTRRTQSGEDTASAIEKEKLQSTAGSGLGARGKTLEGAPKQMPGEDPAAFGARMREYREKQRTGADQATALRKKP